MDAAFLDRVENRWHALIRSASAAACRSRVSRPRTGELRIEVETNEAQAVIAAWESSRTLRIVVHRFKDDRVLFDGGCPTDHELERRLGSLCSELSASPFP
jgi:hypothetical protein